MMLGHFPFLSQAEFWGKETLFYTQVKVNFRFFENCLGPFCNLTLNATAEALAPKENLTFDCMTSHCTVNTSSHVEKMVYNIR